ncbi:MAG: sulfotransferase [Cytophagia bacterium]|nr:sulfotransferase [Cytophagia bacterium]
MAKQPVIIIGMHRSGTTLLTELLEKCGLFVGQKKFGNKEAIFFQELNRWWLFQTGTTWDNPTAFQYAHPTFLTQAEKVFKWRSKSHHLQKYLGLIKTIQHRNLKNLNFEWGWKDPVNSITLDIWMKIFPEAKIVNITRNPLDVAMSLKIREESRIKQFGESSTLSNREKRLIYRPAYNQSYRVLDIQEGVKLTIEYLQINKNSLAKYKDHYQLSYEDLLSDPFHQIQELTNFLNLNTEDRLLAEVVENINPDKANKFLHNSELRQLYSKMNLKILFAEYGFTTPEAIEA